MNSQNRIPWHRVLVEAGAIVLSILLAFAIDAWWSERQERVVERQALVSLQSDFVGSRETLISVLRLYERSQAEYTRFRSATPLELASLQPDSIEAVMTAFTFAGTFDPDASTLDALVRDGRLRLISDRAPRESLPRWPRGLDDIEENAVDVRSEAIRIRRAMEGFGGPFQRPGRTFGGAERAEIDLRMLPAPDAATLSALRRDAEFMGLTRSHQFAMALYMRELNELASILDSTLVLIEEGIQ